MKEDIIQFLWKQRRFNPAQLTTLNGEKITILAPGIHNKNSGPDFLNARIRIDDTEWVGHVEIHVYGSDWRKHNHTADDAYNNVILHVVYFHDEQALNKQGQPVPTLELMGRINPDDLDRCQELLNTEAGVPCSALADKIPALHKLAAVERQAMQRLENKYRAMSSEIHALAYDWEQLTFIRIARAFGLGVNSGCFEDLAMRLPVNHLRRVAHNLQQMDAILFGTAGLLPKQHGFGYVKTLQEEFNDYQRVHPVRPMFPCWKFARTHPHNFPTVRLAQLSTVVFHNKQLFSTITDAINLRDITGMFGVEPSSYWKNHFSFDGNVQTNYFNNGLGETAVSIILSNAVLPLLFTYGKLKDREDIMEKALQWMQMLPAENNRTTRLFESFGFPNENALHSQGILELNESGCRMKKCLSCAVGSTLLGRKNPILHPAQY